MQATKVYSTLHTTSCSKTHSFSQDLEQLILVKSKAERDPNGFVASLKNGVRFHIRVFSNHLCTYLFLEIIILLTQLLLNTLNKMRFN